MYLAGPILADILYHIGNEQQRHWRRWRSSATGAPPWCSPNPTPARTSAPAAPRRSQQPDGTWHIDGVKRFITNGDSDDLFENIMHMVLARPEGAGPGTKGLSLFLVPKFLLDLEDRRTGRAQRRLRHRPRAQDGPQGVGDVRADVRPARHARGRMAGRRHPQRHRADVQDHRVRANDGRHQGDCDAVDRATSTRWSTRRPACRAPT